MPSGCWCDGVTNARRKRGARRRPSSTRSPSSSTGNGTSSAPAAMRLLRAPIAPGFSNQTRSPGLSNDEAISENACCAPRHDEDLLRVAGDAAIGAQMRGDRLAQRRMAERIAVPHHLAAMRRQCLADSRAHCAIGNASKAGSAVVKARATDGNRSPLAEPLRPTAPWPATAAAARCLARSAGGAAGLAGARRHRALGRRRSRRRPATRSVLRRPGDRTPR